MDNLPVPETLLELQKYIVDFRKSQKINNEGEAIDPIPFSLYSWSGGFLWFRVPGVRVKKYWFHIVPFGYSDFSLSGIKRRPFLSVSRRVSCRPISIIYDSMEGQL